MAHMTGANLLPNSYCEIFQAMKQHDESMVTKILPSVSSIAGLYSQKISYMPHITKYAMKILGYPVLDKICDPIDTLPDKMKKKIEKTMNEHGEKIKL
jgi:dihydrodipicolinate synthase/N-acetylneuraminate lyase